MDILFFFLQAILAVGTHYYALKHYYTPYQFYLNWNIVAVDDRLTIDNIGSGTYIVYGLTLKEFYSRVTSNFWYSF